MASTQRDIICPKCGSRNIYVDKRGFDSKRAVAGGLVTGDPMFALFAGNYDSNKIRLTCLNCGHTFNIGEGGKEMPSAEEVREFESHVIPREEMPETSMFKCDCGNTFCGPLHSYCPKCGRRMEKRHEFTAEDYKERYSTKGCMVVLLLPIVVVSTLLCLL